MLYSLTVASVATPESAVVELDTYDAETVLFCTVPEFLLVHAT
jgi:hypothetical protein